MIDNKTNTQPTQSNSDFMQNQADIINCLTQKYALLCLIDIETDSFISYKVDNFISELLNDDWTTVSSAKTLFELYVDKFVVKADQAKMREQGSVENIIKRLSNEHSFTVEYRSFRKNALAYCQLFIARVGNDINAKKYIMGFSNIDEIEKEQAHHNLLQEANTQLENALEKAQSTANAKSVFLFNMSHDIRTPMNAILGFADIAEQYIDDTKKVADCISKIKSSGDYLLKLINDVLDMARIESGKVVLCEEPMNLYESNNAILNIYKNSMQLKDINFISDINVQNPYVYGDLLRLEQIVSNLISNAFKFTKSGGRVEYHFTQISEVSHRHATYEIRIKDTGMGMTKEFQKHMFEQFERERTSTVSGIQGTGLGLAITKKIVDLMAGEISVNSELGKGTEFIIRFNLRVQTEANPIPSETDIKEIDISGNWVLLVEDNELNRELATIILEDLGLEVDTAENGVIAVEKVKSLKDKVYDFILMDIQMPLMNGYEATRTIRSLKDKKLAGIPIIALSANAFEDDKERSFVVGMNAHIAKPIDKDNLVHTIHNILSDTTAFVPISTMKLTEYEEKNNSLGIKGGYLIYENSDEEKILYASEELVSMFGCVSFDEFKEYTGNSFRGIVHPDDLERVEAQIKKQIAVSEDNYDFVSYRIIRKDKQIRLVEDMGHLEKTESYGNVFHVYITDITIH